MGYTKSDLRIAGLIKKMLSTENLTNLHRMAGNLEHEQDCSIVAAQIMLIGSHGGAVYLSTIATDNLGSIMALYENMQGKSQPGNMVALFMEIENWLLTGSADGAGGGVPQ